MKKLLIFLTGIFSVMLFAQDQQKNDVYLDYTNKVINYEFSIDDLDKIKAPFYSVAEQKIVKKRVTQKIEVNKVVKIDLMSIFDNKAYIKINEYIGDKLIKTEKKWIKVGDKVYGCKLIKLTESDAVLKCKNKILYKTLNQKIPLLRNSK